MISVKNIYYMLSYAYQVLNESGYAKYSYEKFSDAETLFAHILHLGVRHEIKRGINKDYHSVVDEDSKVIRGKLDIALSMKQYALSKRTVCCLYDEYCENSIINQILKASINYELHSATLDDSIKKELRKDLPFFRNVDQINVSQIRWNSLRFDRNNASYKMLTNVCYLLINGLISAESEDGLKMARYVDSQKMHALYENFIRAYYKKHFPVLNPSATHIEWKSDGYIDFLPEMRSDITLTHGNVKLIIDAKYYDKSMQIGRFGNRSVHSGNLYQIFTYVHNADTSNDKSVSGLLLYAKTDEEITPNNTYRLDSYRIDVKSLDLNCDFEQIKHQLDRIVYEWLGIYGRSIKKVE